MTTRQYCPPDLSEAIMRAVGEYCTHKDTGRLAYSYQEIVGAVNLALEKLDPPTVYRLKETSFRMWCRRHGLHSGLDGRRVKSALSQDIPTITLTVQTTPPPSIAAPDTQRDAYMAFEKIWNNSRLYPARYDLERAFGKSWNSIRTSAGKWREFFLEFLNSQQGLEAEYLPELIFRNATTGNRIGMPPALARKLAPFRFPTERLEGARGVLITSVQRSAALDMWCFNAMKGYSEHHGIPFPILTMQYGRIPSIKIGREVFYTSTFPDELKGHLVLPGEDIELVKDELVLSTMQILPTMESPLTPRTCAKGGMKSQILATSKLALRHLMRVGRRYPKAIMGTGAITHPNYDIDPLGQQKRVCELATEEHTYSGIVVEFDDKKIFHFRQLHANRRGEFYDIDPRNGGARFFSPSGNEHRPDDVEAIVLGDIHLYKEDPMVMRATFEKGGIIPTLRPKHIIVQDTFDHDGVSWFDEKNTSRKALKARLGWDLVEDELQYAIKKLRWIREVSGATIHVVPGNHDEMLTTWVQRLEYQKDARNRRTGAMLHELCDQDLDARGVSRHNARTRGAFMLYVNRHAGEGIYAYDRQEAVQFPKNAKNPILILHGDKGVRGGETRSTKEFREANQRVVLGHNHSATIDGPIWRVGVMQRRMATYINAPATNWTNTHCVIFKNGQRMLINIINGRWHGQGQL